LKPGQKGEKVAGMSNPWYKRIIDMYPGESHAISYYMPR
jgi:hypothetical protein